MAVGTFLTYRNSPAWYSRYVTRSDGSVHLADQRTVLNRMTESVTHGPNIPNWKERMMRGEDVTTQLSGVRFTGRRSRGFYSFTFDPPSKSTFVQQGDLHTENPGLIGVIDPSFTNQARTNAMIAFSKNWGKKTRQWQSGIFAGELLEVARMLSNPAKGLRSAANDLYSSARRAIRGQKPGSTAYRKNLAGAYLEWNFGVKPLVQDLDDAARAFRAVASGRTFDMVRITGVGEASGEPNIGGANEVRTWFPAAEIAGAGLYSRSVIDSSQVTLRGGWRNQNPSGEMPLPDIIGLQLQQLLPTAWELLPWSFLADYFTNIGDVLEAWSMRFVTFAWLNQTIRNCRTVKCSDIWIGPQNPGNKRLGRGGHAVFKRYDVQRGPTTNQFDPGFYLEMPGFGGNDARKWLNISALLAMRGG